MKTLNILLKPKTKTFMTCVTAALVTSVVQARTDVPAKVEQLKQNTEASRENLKQYEENLKIVDGNIRENSLALKQIQKQKTSLELQKIETAKGKAGVDAVKKQIAGYMLAEQKKLEIEKKQIEDLKKTLATLEDNQIKRAQNIAEYQSKLDTVEGEMAAWSERNQSMKELEGAIHTKEKEALADQKNFASKKSTYQEEVAKWKKQARVSERQYENFSKIKD